MFDNVGGKIKAFAEVIIWIGIICSIIGGIILITDGNIGIGITVLFGGPIASLLFSFVLYGFGQLVENSDRLVSVNSQNGSNSSTDGKTDNASSNSSADTSDEKLSVHKWRCPKCHYMISSFPCEFCGYQSGNETPPDPRLGKCELCDREKVRVTECRIVDDWGTRYRKICADCMKKYNAEPEE